MSFEKNKMRKLLIFTLLLPLSIFAQKQKISSEEYITTYKDLAISEMKRTGIPASITLAQGILESGNGNSDLAVKAKNHFGIKCHSGWKGKTFIMDDDTEDECFRVYKNVKQSYIDHSDFLTVRGRYSFLFDLRTTDYKGWALGLKKAGYATNPKYPKLLISLIEKYNLSQYDAGAKRRFETSEYFNAITFNHSKIVYAKEGETYTSIGKKYNISTKRIFLYNDVTKDRKITKGTRVYLQPKRGRAQEKFHIVKAGETLLDISNLHGVRLKLLRKRNLLGEFEEPKKGQKIFLNKKRKEKVETSQKANKYGIRGKKYTVKKGDTLYSIAKEFDVTVDEIKKSNGLKTNDLNLGQELLIKRK